MSWDAECKKLYQGFGNFWMVTSLVELLYLYLPGFTRSAELVSQKRSKTLTFHTPAERHGALQIISLAGQDIPANVRNDSCSETKNTKVLITSLLDSYQKECQTVKGHQQQHQSILLVVSRQQSLQPTSKIQSRVKLRDLA